MNLEQLNTRLQEYTTQQQNLINDLNRLVKAKEETEMKIHQFAGAKAAIEILIKEMTDALLAEAGAAVEKTNVVQFPEKTEDKPQE